MIVFRNTDIDAPFLWETRAQPPGRWHDSAGGPAQYFSSTSDAAWAEFLRREEIREAADLAGIERVLWAVEIDEDEPAVAARLPRATMTGGRASYRACQLEAVRLRRNGASRIVAPSAAVDAAAPSGWRVENGLRSGMPRTETTMVLFGARPDLVGWRSCAPGAPGVEILSRVSYRK